MEECSGSKERDTSLILFGSVINLCQHCYCHAIFQALDPQTDIQLHGNAKVLVVCSRVYGKEKDLRIYLQDKAVQPTFVRSELQVSVYHASMSHNAVSMLSTKVLIQGLTSLICIILLSSASLGFC